VFAKGLEESLPSYLGMARNGTKHGSTALADIPLSSALGHLDFLFVVSTVFSLLALLFTFDAVAGEKEAGTLRLTLANAIPRDVFLWSKLIGGYLVFVVPFLAALLFGLLMLVWQGFPLGAPDIFPRILCLTLVALLYIAVFFAIGTVISTGLDSSRTALIVCFTVWVFSVLIAPRVGFLTAKWISPARTSQSVYMEKAVIRNNLNDEKKKVLGEKITGALGNRISFTDEVMAQIRVLRQPIDEAYWQKFQKQANQIDNAYQRERARQERHGETLSRITPTACFIYVAMNLTDTGKLKRDTYFQAATRYYRQLSEEYFSGILDDDFAMLMREKPIDIAPPPELAVHGLSETLSRSLIDVLLLCFFALVFITMAFLKFFQTEI